jgi:hypothetical protein
MNKPVVLITEALTGMDRAPAFAGEGRSWLV